jgi:HK97 family phage prohead protease
MKRAIETRAVATEIRAIDTDDGPVIEGYAAVFNRESEDLFGFREQIQRGAFAKTLSEKPDVRALWNHDHSVVLGRTKSGTLELEEDEIGLKMRLHPPESAADKIESIRRGDVDGMSFGFRVIKDAWDNSSTPQMRTLQEVELIEVSPVTFPAYPATAGKLSVRSYLESIGEDEQRIEEITGESRTDEPVPADHSEGEEPEAEPVPADHSEEDARAEETDMGLVEARLNAIERGL